jgi:hypothetical protein
MLGYILKFPDTSNVHFQCYCDADAVLIIHQPLLLEFLGMVKHKKDLGKFNHLELNIFLGLSDPPTITELCVLVLYTQTVSQPYMQKVQGTNTSMINVLDLGPPMMQ